MKSDNEPGSGTLSETIKGHFSSFFDLILEDRRNLYRELRRRVLLLKEIVDEKTRRNMPISQRETECLERFSYLLHENDALKVRSEQIMSGILQAIKSHDANSLNNISLFPSTFLSSVTKDEVCKVSRDKDEELKLEALISVCAKENHPDFTKDVPKNISLADIIAAVNAEKGNSRVNRKSKRKISRTKFSARRSAQPVSKRNKPRFVYLVDNICFRKELSNFPPALMQYVRGFFNALRIIMISMAESEHGLSTEKICEIVKEWSSDHRIRCINSHWIAKCEDWSEVVRPALSLLSGDNPGFMVTSSPVFISFNPSTRSWRWIGHKGSRNVPGDSAEAAETEAVILARMFSLWVKSNDLNGGNRSGNRSSQFSSMPSHSNEADDIEDDFGDVDDVDELMEKAEERVPAGSVRSRRRHSRPEQIPPPFFPTDWQCKLSTAEQRRQFQEQEEKRYSMPWSPYVYNQNGYPSVVGPVLREGANGSGNRIRAALSAREHPLLRTDRPPWVSISEIVRDAVARLPNGEGTRPEIAMLVQDSGYLVPSFNIKQLNQCISSALDRLQSESTNSPVMYDPIQRLWIYRFRHLSPTDFFRLYRVQSEYQRELFRQIYPRGCVAVGGSSAVRRRSSASTSRSRQKDSRTTPMEIEYMDDEHIPDIEDLTQEDQEAGESVDEQDDEYEEEEQEVELEEREEEEGGGGGGGGREVGHDVHYYSGSESASSDENNDREVRFDHPHYRHRYHQQQRHRQHQLQQRRDQNFHYQPDMFQ